MSTNNRKAARAPVKGQRSNGSNIGFRNQREKDKFNVKKAKIMAQLRELQRPQRFNSKPIVPDPILVQGVN